MGAFRVLLGSLHYMGLYMQLSVSTRQAGHGEVENHISGNGRCAVRFRIPLIHPPTRGLQKALCVWGERTAQVMPSARTREEELNKEGLAGGC
ncbi:hypothetical protein VZT92_026327 [Zoarces viviparus]|uniref:Secreted protein n=1 Tax=Zoarces viviparus TaxID=48416 RepID=A0AAW1DZG3_ZOAVI